MKINLRGCTRIVFIFRNVVIKVPSPRHSWANFLQGLLANMNEGKTWRWNSGKYECGRSYLLCPVIWSAWGGWVLIMKRAELLTVSQWEDIVDISAYIETFPGDDTISNYGNYKGRLVKIDYGSLDIQQMKP